MWLLENTCFSLGYGFSSYYTVIICFAGEHLHNLLVGLHDIVQITILCFDAMVHDWLLYQHCNTGIVLTDKNITVYMFN